jgi:hypothetical protein
MFAFELVSVFTQTLHLSWTNVLRNCAALLTGGAPPSEVAQVPGEIPTTLVQNLAERFGRLPGLLITDVGISDSGADVFVSEELLNFPQILSYVVKEDRGRAVAQKMSGNDWHPRALAGELEACVEGLVAKGRAVPARKDERRSREVDSPSPQPHPLHTFQESEPLLERVRQFLCEGRSRKEPPLTWRRAAIIIPPGSQTSRSS